MTEPRHVDLPIPTEVRRIIETLEKAGHTAWAVGGGVRDALLDLRPEDWDITTSARPGEVRKLFQRTVPVGIEHGTVGVLAPSSKMYEVTTYRRDVETFGRKARVEFSDRLEEDLERRDFTMNALAWSPSTRELRDPHGGLKDLESGILRTVGDPDQRFAEDRLRVLRALRFAGRFDLRIDAGVWEAIVRSADKLDHLSAERVRDELMKVLSGQRTPSRTLNLYAESGVMGALIPELAPEGGAGDRATWKRTLTAVDSLPPSRPILRLAVLLIGSQGGDSDGVPRARAAEARSVLMRLRFSNADIDLVTHLIAQSRPLPEAGASEGELRRWVRRVGREHVNDLLRVLIAVCRGQGGDAGRARSLLDLRRRTTAVVRSKVPLEVRELSVSGADLKRLGVRPGPLFGELLEGLLERVIEDPSLNERPKLLAVLEAEVERRGE